MATTNQTSLSLSTKQYFDAAHNALRSKYPDLNIFAIPQIEKIDINIGIGRYDEKQKQEIAHYLMRLTSQDPKRVPSKVSIASFKLRKGQTVALVSTLRKEKAQDFLMQLVYIALPRTRDFKGIKKTAFDSNFKCYSLGIPNVAIFPAIGFDTQVSFGMQINIVFKHATPLNLELLEELHIPFKKQ